MNSDLAVLLMGYSRVETIYGTVKKLMRMGISNLYISLDFSNDPVVQVKQQKLVEFLEQSYRDRISIWYRKRNHGVAVGIITAIDWFFENNEKGIILEDDLILNHSFLEFCSNAFDNYQREDVFMISGNKFHHLMDARSVTFTNYPQIWGWATWKVNWIEMRMLITKRKSFRIQCIFSPRKAFFYAGAVRAKNGMVDTWDLPLAYEMLLLDKMCLLPPANLVSNIGSDQYAVHTKQNNFPLNFPIAEISDFEFPNPKKLIESCESENRYLENYIFRVKRRHLLSPLKVWISFLFRKAMGKEFRNLESRLKDAEKFVH